MTRTSDLIGTLRYTMESTNGNTVKLPRQLVQDVIWKLEEQIRNIEWHRKHGDLDPSDYDL